MKRSKLDRLRAAHQEIHEAKLKADRFNQICQRAANAWVQGNNSGNSDIMEKKDAECDRLRRKAEAMLPKGCEVDWPGLFPVITHRGNTYHGSASWEIFV